MTAELTLGLARAAALVLGRSARGESRRAVAVVARDPRVSGEFIAAAVSAGLASAGAAFLVYTGVALALRRLAAWRARRRILPVRETQNARVA